MDFLKLVSIVISLAAILAYLNIRFLKLPSTIGVMVLSLLLSLVVLLAGSTSHVTDLLKHLVHKLDFSAVLLDFMLGFMLFAGALHTDVSNIRKSRGPIYTFATLGTVLSTILVGTALYFVIPLLYHPVSYILCLLFGALISPTDPIAVLSILKKAGIAERTETQITGESLFNDGVGVVLFLTLLNIAANGVEQVSSQEVLLLIVKEVFGGIGFGLLLGYVGYFMLKRIDHYQTEVLITLAMVMGGITIAPLFHFSGPLAMVMAGLLIGSKGSEEAMSDQTSDYVHKFWEMVDEIMNAILFVLIGLELLIVPFQPAFLLIGGLAILVLLLARFASLFIPSFLFRFKNNLSKPTLLIMTWGGLRGGISVALALSLSAAMERNLMVSVTYVVVLFSILVQGLTLGKLVSKLSGNSVKGKEVDQFSKQ